MNCRLCDLPVVSESVSGPDVCSWCDLGICRFTRGHRVDAETINPSTGKQYLPTRHYATQHPREWREFHPISPTPERTP